MKGSVKKNDDKTFQLTSWFVSLAPTSSVYVQGILRGEDAEEPWGSSAIVGRVNGRTLQSKTGNIYKLLGLLNAEEAIKNGFPNHLCHFFKHGFPRNWQTLLGPCSSSEKTHCRNISGRVLLPKLAVENSCLDVSSLPRTRYGRIVFPPLQFWRGERRITVQDELPCDCIDPPRKSNVSRSHKKTKYNKKQVISGQSSVGSIATVVQKRRTRCDTILNQAKRKLERSIMPSLQSQKRSQLQDTAENKQLVDSTVRVKDKSMLSEECSSLSALSDKRDDCVQIVTKRIKRSVCNQQECGDGTGNTHLKMSAKKRTRRPAVLVSRGMEHRTNKLTGKLLKQSPSVRHFTKTVAKRTKKKSTCDVVVKELLANRKTISTPRGKVEEDNTGVSAKPGTLRFRQQVRDFLCTSSWGEDDDFLKSSPYRTKRRLNGVLNLDSYENDDAANVKTPRMPIPVFAPVSMEKTPCVSTGFSPFDDAVDRKKVDHYLLNRNKRKRKRSTKSRPARLQVSKQLREDADGFPFHDVLCTDVDETITDCEDYYFSDVDF